MIAVIILLAVTAGLIYYQVFTQGLFSCFIMAVLSVIAAVTAMNYYMPLAALLDDLTGMGYLGFKGISLLAIFCVTLFVLRELSDRLIRGNMKFSTLVDRVGSTAFAVVSSLTITGMIALGIQNMPVTPVILGFNRCPQLDNPDADKNLLPYGDNFVVMMMNKASSYCFAGAHSFVQFHPDYLRELYLGRLVPENQEGSRREAARNAIKINKAWIIRESVKDELTNEYLELRPGESIIAVQLSITPGRDVRGDRGAKDLDGAVRYALGHFRLVGYNPTEKMRPGISEYPIGQFTSSNGRTYRKATLDTGYVFKTGKKAVAYLLFRWPVKIEDIPPKFVEFKRSARAALPGIKSLKKAAGGAK